MYSSPQATNTIYVPRAREPPSAADYPRMAQQAVATLSEQVANEVAGRVLRGVSSGAIEWMSRALSSDQMALDELFATNAAGRFESTDTTKDLPAFLPLLGRPREQAPYADGDIRFPDYNQYDRTVDCMYLMYAPAMREYFPTGPSYWLGKFLEADFGPQHPRGLNPLSFERRTAMHIDCGAIKQHFTGQHDGIFCGIVNPWAGLDDKTVDKVALALSWAVARLCYQHWLSCMAQNALQLGEELGRVSVSARGNNGSIDAGEAARLRTLLEAPRIDSTSGLQPAATARYAAPKPMEQYASYQQSAQLLPKDGDPEGLVCMRLIDNWVRNATEDARLLANVMQRLMEDTDAVWPDLVLGVHGALPPVEAEAVIIDSMSWMREALSQQWTAGRWSGELSRRLGSARHYMACNNWAAYMSQLWAHTQAVCLRYSQPRHQIRLPNTNSTGAGGENDYAGPWALGCRPFDGGVVEEIASALIDVDCSGESARAGRLLPDGEISHRSGCYRLAVELREAFGVLDTVLSPVDRSLVEVEVAQDRGHFISAREYLNDEAPSSASGVRLTPLYESMVQSQYAVETHEPPSLEEQMAAELVRVKTELSPSKGNSIFLGLTDLLKNAKLFRDTFGKLDEPAVKNSPDTTARIINALETMRVSARIQHSFWLGAFVPEDVRRHSGPYWARVERHFDRMLQRMREQHEPFWVTAEDRQYNDKRVRTGVRDRVCQKLLHSLQHLVLNTMQTIEDHAADANCQEVTNQQLKNDRGYRALINGFAPSCTRVVRSRRQRAADRGLLEYRRMEQRVKSMRVPERNVIWGRVARDAVLQWLKGYKRLPVKNCAQVASTVRFTHQTVQEWEKAQRDFLSQTATVDSDDLDALRLYELVLPPPFYSMYDSVVFSLTLPENECKEMVRDLVERRHCSAALAKKLSQVDQHLAYIIEGVRSIQRMSQEARDCYFLWATFDPFLHAPFGSYSNAAGGTTTFTFTFEVRLYRTLDSQAQASAFAYARELGRLLLNYRREALRLYEQYPMITAGYDPSPKAAHPDAKFASPRYYRALYLVQDLGCTTSTTHDTRGVGSKDAWREVKLLCHDSTVPNAQSVALPVSHPAYVEQHSKLVASLLELYHGVGLLPYSPAPFLAL